MNNPLISRMTSNAERVSALPSAVNVETSHDLICMPAIGYEEQYTLNMKLSCTYWVNTLYGPAHMHENYNAAILTVNHTVYGQYINELHNVNGLLASRRISDAMRAINLIIKSMQGTDDVR